MARFRYRLQNILNIRLQQEEQQKNAFAEAQRALSDEEEKLGMLKAQLAGFQQEAIRLSQGELDVKALQDNDHNIEVMEELIKRQRVEVSRAEKIVEIERQRLTEAMQERKIHERLKEKAFEAYWKEEGREEARINDERSGFVYGQRTGEEA